VKFLPRKHDKFVVIEHLGGDSFKKMKKQFKDKLLKGGIK
jgi:hypothetical protein